MWKEGRRKEGCVSTEYFNSVAKQLKRMNNYEGFAAVLAGSLIHILSHTHMHTHSNSRSNRSYVPTITPLLPLTSTCV